MKNETTATGDDRQEGLSARQHSQLREKLAALPDSGPPRAVWQRIEEQASAEGLLRRPVLSDGTRWAAGAAIAAGVVLAVLNLPNAQLAQPGEGVVDNVPLRTEPAFDAYVAESQSRSINALMVRSQFLERDLRRLPASPQLMRADTAATIDELQDRIAGIDYQLSQQDEGLTSEAQEVFWRERVRLMDSLVKLRLAQSQRGAF